MGEGSDDGWLFRLPKTKEEEFKVATTFSFLSLTHPLDHFKTVIYYTTLFFFFSNKYFCKRNETFDWLALFLIISFLKGFSQSLLIIK